MATIAGNTVDYIIERKNTENGSTNLMNFAAYNGTFTVTDTLDTATKYTEKDKALKNAEFQNMLASFNALPYEYYVIERSTDMFVLDAEGNRKES